MHEFSLINELLEEVEQIRTREGAVAITTIELDCGPLCGVEPELLQFAFDSLGRDRLGNECTLILNRPPLRAACSACGNVFSPTLDDFRCDLCGSGEVRVTHGETLILRQVVLESHYPRENRGGDGSAVLDKRTTP
jgi:hydrogenase nickel incorporation protein HypA/HybF